MKNAKHSWKSLLAAFLSVAILTMMFVPSLTALAADESTLPEPKTQAEEGWVRYHAEHFYTGNRTDGDKAADMQPSEEITIPMNAYADFAAGRYTLSLRTCGDRSSYEVLVDGTNIGTITREGSGWGDYGIAKLEAMLELKADSVITLKSPASGYGWVDYVQIDTYAEEPVEPTLPEPKTETGEGWVRYHAEHFYTGNRTDGDKAADMQPSEEITIPVNAYADFAAGKYTLSLRTCGDRTSYEVLVDGTSVGTITREGSGWGDYGIAKLEATLELTANSVITLKSPASGYGWVDYVQLEVYTESSDPTDPVEPTDPVDPTDPVNPADPTDPVDPSEEPAEPTLPEPKTQAEEGWVRYHAEHFYTGNRTDGDKAADMQPSEEITIPVNAYADFAAGKYTLSLRTCGDRTSYEVLVDGTSVGTITREGSGWGDYGIAKLEATLELKADSVITLKSPASGYGWVDYVQLDVYTEKPVDPVDPTLPDSAVESGDGWYQYQAEYFYNGNISENVAADLQPGETLGIPVDAVKNFAEGEYTLTVRSCGNRESFEVLVNGKSEGTITRTGTGFGMDQMTDNKMSQTLTLKPGDVISLKAPDGEFWGWVDYIRLDVYTEEPVDPDKPVDPPLPDGSVESGGGRHQYQAMYFYNGKIAENAAADLQPGEVLEIPVDAVKSFVEGEYILTVRSNGNRESFEVLVNGKSVGTITRTGTGFGMDQMTNNKLSQTLALKPGDVISLKAPNGEFWGWVAGITLDLKQNIPVGDDDRTYAKIEAESGSFDPASGKESGTSDAGQSWISGFQNMTASYAIPDSVKPGLYRLYMGYITPASDCSIAVGFGGGERSIKVKPSENADAWNWGNAKLGALMDLNVKPGDTFTIRTTGTTPWVQIDYFLLIPLGEDGEPLPGSVPDDLYIPATGDTVPVYALGAVLLLSAVGLAVMVSKRKRFI